MTPDDLHRRITGDPRASLKGMLRWDRLCLFATHEDGTNTTSDAIEVGCADPCAGWMIDEIIMGETGECGGPTPSPVVSVEVVHQCRVMTPWTWCDGAWIRATLADLPDDNEAIVRIVGDDADGSRRSRADRDLMASGWRLMNPMAAPDPSPMSGAAASPPTPRIAPNAQLATMALLLTARDRWACQGVIVVTPPIAASHGEPWRATVVNYLGDHAHYMTAPTEDALYRTLTEMAP